MEGDEGDVVPGIAEASATWITGRVLLGEVEEG